MAISKQNQSLTKRELIGGLFGLSAIGAISVFSTNLSKESDINPELLRKNNRIIPNSSVYGDINLDDWQWARQKAIDETLEFYRLKEEGIPWVRTNLNISQPYIGHNKILFFDGGHNDMTRGGSLIARGAVARDGTTEAEMVDIIINAMQEAATEKGYKVVLTRRPDEIIDIPEFNHLNSEGRKSHYARMRGAQIDFMADRLGFDGSNARAISFHFDRSRLLEGETDFNRLHGRAILVNKDSADSVEFARSILRATPQFKNASYVSNTNGLYKSDNLAILRGCFNMPIILKEIEFMSNHPKAVAMRKAIIRDNGKSFADTMIEAIAQDFPIIPLRLSENNMPLSAPNP